MCEGRYHVIHDQETLLFEIKIPYYITAIRTVFGHALRCREQSEKGV